MMEDGAHVLFRVYHRRRRADMIVRATLVLVLLAVVGFVAGRNATAQTAKPAPAPAAPVPTNCKTFGGGHCCDPAVSAHLSKESVFSACGESDATFLGEQG